MILIYPAISTLRPFSLISLCKFRTETSWIPTTNANKTRPSPRFKSFCCSKMALALFWNANVELPVRKPDDLTSHCLIAFRMEFHWVPPLNCNYIFILIFEDSCALLEVKAKKRKFGTHQHHQPLSSRGHGTVAWLHGQSEMLRPARNHGTPAGFSPEIREVETDLQVSWTSNWGHSLCRLWGLPWSCHCQGFQR